MTFSERAQTFAGKTVVDYQADERLPDPAQFIPRLRVEYDAQVTPIGLLQSLLRDPAAEAVTGLVLGAWGSEMYSEGPDELIELLIASAPQLPNLRALFIGDIIGEECEASWLNLTDMSPIWEAFPRLEILKIRGAQGLSLGEIRHRHLKELYLESGGLGVDVLQEIADADLPQLEVLSIYLGDGGYGWDGTLEDLQPFLSGRLFPKLKVLGLCNSEITDAIAEAAATAPILARLETLDLSQGTIGDAGATALLKSPAVAKLKKLDLTRHYISARVQSELLKLPIEVVLDDDQGEADPDDRYVAVSE